MEKPEIFNYSKEDKKLIADAIRNLADDVDYLDWYNMSIKNQDAIEFLIKSDIAMRDRVNFFNHYADLISLYELEPSYKVIRHDAEFEDYEGMVNPLRIYYQNWKINYKTKAIYLYPEIIPDLKKQIEILEGKFPSTLLGYYFLQIPVDIHGKITDKKYFDFYWKVSRYIDMDAYSDCRHIKGLRQIFEPSSCIEYLYGHIAGRYSGTECLTLDAKKITELVYKILDLTDNNNYVRLFDLQDKVFDFAYFLSISDDTVVNKIFNQMYHIKDITGKNNFIIKYFINENEDINADWGCFSRFINNLIKYHESLYINPERIELLLANKKIESISDAFIELYFVPHNISRKLWNLIYSTDEFEMLFLIHLINGNKLETFRGTKEYLFEISAEIANRFEEILEKWEYDSSILGYLFLAYCKQLGINDNIAKTCLDYLGLFDSYKYKEDQLFYNQLMLRLYQDETLKENPNLGHIITCLQGEYEKDKTNFSFDNYPTDQLIKISLNDLNTKKEKPTVEKVASMFSFQSIEKKDSLDKSD